MSRFKEYLEKTAPVVAEQFQKFWRSEYLYLNVLNQKGTDLGRLGIEVNPTSHYSIYLNMKSSLILELQAPLQEISDQSGLINLLLLLIYTKLSIKDIQLLK